ncbi:FMN-binding protein [Selenihalanaerobacter shriftii]|uniref:Na+-transporting NADH:ubiquinone oxidoreductase subunit C n=1 Tax=Selenihalanaerobacter shriftii TaxID=142842 RepID=A0A1T4PU14_9FIRM|nr:FMN-binding protein [Selenihalanaerobacter shriftii]SJZ95055.1 Na+-transporting NADH:ubiquinone oxidoreductase subunit C [Selenihalanaerobacter shriftii]
MKTNTNVETEIQTKDILLDKAKMVIFMLIIGLVIAGILVGFNSYTKPLVEKNAKIRNMEKVLDAFNIKYKKDNIAEVYENKITVVEKGDQRFYKTNNGDIAFKYTGKGLWGDIIGFMAFKADMKTIKGLSIMTQSETPGLGGRIGEEWFLKQFEGLNYKPKIKILKSSKTADEPNEIDGIAGATLTGDALQKILNNNIQETLPNLEVN